jgi:transformation/transcription domain-associated protein
MDSFAYGFAEEGAAEETKTQDLLQSLIRDLVGMATTPEVGLVDLRPTFNHVASKFIALCVDDLWVSKSAGCKGIRFLSILPGLGVRWVTERILEIVRTLLHVMKDMPYDLPEQVQEVTETMDQALRVAYTEMSSLEEPTPSAKNIILALTGICFAEVSGQNALVRRAAQHCISLISELTGISMSELLMPHRERMLTAIYTKPLRALPFPAQVGMVEGIRYCLSLDPPLPELSEELLRLLHEALALADAEDNGFAGSKTNPRQVNSDVVKLRVACIKLLTASMPMTDFFAKQNNTRQRLVSTRLCIEVHDELIQPF